jgi:hypothetical protein
MRRRTRKETFGSMQGLRLCPRIVDVNVDQAWHESPTFEVNYLGTGGATI